MADLNSTLFEYDLHLLQIIANRWDVDLDTRDEKIAAARLAEAMLIPEQAAHEWSRLSDAERGALQLLLASRQHKMPAVQFGRLYGEIRQVGAGAREREKPHLSPKGIAEILFYRGLVALGFDESKTGLQPYVYVPDDLAAILPIHQTGYDLSAEPDDLPDEIEDEELGDDEMEEAELEIEAPPHQQKGDTTLVDDMTTLLAYLQVHEAKLEEGYLANEVQDDLLAQFIGPKEYPRLDLLIQLAGQMGLMTVVNGAFQPIRQAARTWLESSRTAQVKTLVEAWRTSDGYNELWLVPTLEPEATGWQNDPTLPRETLRGVFEAIPGEGWVSLDGLVDEIKAVEPDFQRPGGDYSSWYIRERRTGEYLRGFESWEVVEGALLKFIIAGPLHWLGLVDLGMDAPDGTPLACHLNVFGKAWVGQGDWPNRKDPETPLTLDASGKMLVPRAASRIDRFQLARFTEWGAPADPYVYLLNSKGFKRAEQQGIKPENVETFLQRTVHTIPPHVQALIENWRKAQGASAVIQKMLVLRVDTEVLMDVIWDTPEIRRFLGVKLGPLAVAVREDQWQGLVSAMQDKGIPVETEI
ncbi:MAG: hypothetical protein HY862_04255 [Chloroflexi bacterium]|nr:hypothetical protein [Chloroflexota bacterium]